MPSKLKNLLKSKVLQENTEIKANDRFRLDKLELEEAKKKTAVAKEKSQKHDWINLRIIRKTFTYSIASFLGLFMCAFFYYALITVFPTIQDVVGTKESGKLAIQKFIIMGNYLIVGGIVGQFINNVLKS